MDLSTLDFAQARTKHILFKTQLRAILYHGQEDQQQVSLHTACALGQWIYGGALAAYSQIPEVIELEKVHREVHTAAAHLIDLYRQGRVEEARAGFTSVEILAADLIMWLSVVENKISPAHTAADLAHMSERLTISYEELEQLRKILYDLDERIREETAHTLRARQTALVNEYKFQHSLMQAPIGMVILRGRTLVIEMVNDTYLNIIDRVRGEVENRPLMDVLPEVKDAVQPLMDNVLDTGRPFHGNEFEVQLRRHGKTEKAYFNFVYQPLRDGDEVTGIMAVANDVTNLVKAKHVLQQSETQFRNMVTQSPIAMTIFRGADWVIDLANETLLNNIWRRTASEVMGKRLLDAFPELQGQKFPELLRTVWETGTIYRESEAMAYVDSHDGRKKYYLDFEYAPLRELNGAVSAIMVTVNDVTGKVEAREKIEAAEQRLRLAVEATDMGTFDWDLEHQEFYSSPRLLEIFGFPAEAFITHQQLIAALHPSDLPIRDRAIRASFTTGGLSYEARIVWPDSSVHWIRVHGKIVHDKENKPLRMYGTAIDITQQRTFTEALEIKVKERTAELEKTNNALQKSNEELAQFAFVASHDLQEPLRKIQTFASRIQATETALTDRGKDYFRRMQQASMQMQQLIADVLSYSRMNATEQHVEALALGVLLAKVQEHLSERIEEVGATIEAGVLPVLKVIPYQFEQLLSNILSNALKYIRPGVPPRIVITADTVPGKAIDPLASEEVYHRIVIADNGIGFEPQYSERIFQVFQRLHSKNEYEGTGIGLAICKKIIDNHHGFITAAGEPGKGAAFTLYLPA
jgi:PAS domain S-box-containing protein